MSLNLRASGDLGLIESTLKSPNKTISQVQEVRKRLMCSSRVSSALSRLPLGGLYTQAMIVGLVSFNDNLTHSISMSGVHIEMSSLVVVLYLEWTYTHTHPPDNLPEAKVQSFL